MAWGAMVCALGILATSGGLSAILLMRATPVLFILWILSITAAVIISPALFEGDYFDNLQLWSFIIPVGEFVACRDLMRRPAPQSPRTDM